MEKYFFDIPIYRCPIEKHTVELKEDKQKYIQEMFKGVPGKAEENVSYKRLLMSFDTELWYPWQYNEIIGWIRLYAFVFIIKGELWFIKSKVIRRGLKNKVFYYSGKAFELHLNDSYSSSDIFKMILDKIFEYQKESIRIKGRYLDTSNFMTIGNYIDWRQLVGIKS